MPKLPVVSGAEAIRALERLGFVAARQRRSHVVMRRGSMGCVVPNHSEKKGWDTRRPAQTSRGVTR